MMALAQGRGVDLTNLDTASAYQIVLVHPDDCPLLGTLGVEEAGGTIPDPRVSGHRDRHITVGAARGETPVVGGDGGAMAAKTVMHQKGAAVTNLAFAACNTHC